MIISKFLKKLPKIIEIFLKVMCGGPTLKNHKKCIDKIENYY